MRFTNRNNRLRPKSPPPAMNLSSYKDILAITKDLLDVAWKVAPASLVPTGLLLWSYLHTIQWTSLFYDSAMSGTGLVFLVLAAMIIAFAIIVQFIIPSFFIIFTSQFYDRATKIPKEAVRLYQIALFAFLAQVGFIYVSGQSPSTWITLVIPFALTVFYALWKRDKLELTNAFSGFKANRWVKLAMICVLANVSMMGTTFPMLLSIGIATQTPNLTEKQELFTFLTTIFVAIIAVAPGFIYLHRRTQHSNLLRPYKAAFGGLFIIVYITLSTFALLQPVQYMILRASGIFSNVATTFQIRDTGLIDVFSAAGLHVVKGQDFNIVTGSVRYNFGGVRLLCRDPLDLTGSYENENEKANPKRNGAHCVPTKSGELREFRGAIEQ